MDLYQTPGHKSAPTTRPNSSYTAPSWGAPGGNRMKFILITLLNKLSGLELALYVPHTGTQANLPGLQPRWSQGWWRYSPWDPHEIPPVRESQEF